jgi:diketogulonate reductase-like aldo/keto reductase
LFLLHWPGKKIIVDDLPRLTTNQFYIFSGVSGIPNDSEEVIKYRHNAWKSLSKFHKDGLIRSIGVSNYVVKHLEDLKKNFEIVPALNQVEWHPKSHDYELLKYCKDNNIVLQAYSSLGSSSDSSLRNDSTVKKIAAELGKSPSQILLRWATQNNIAIIPKATSKKHLVENMDLNFVIPENQMKILNEFTQKTSSWDPNNVV